MTGTDSESEGDVSDWEIEEGLPQQQDPFIKKYYAGREALIEQEQSQRSDTAFRHSLTPIALEASSIVSRILSEERQSIWTQKLQSDLAVAEEVNMYPGGISDLSLIRRFRSGSFNLN